MGRKLISSDEAVESKCQHSQPCSDCPWARKALNGWLGGMTAEQWIQVAHGDEPVPCHVLKGAQCAGLAIYRSNVAKKPRNPTCIALPANREKVFATPMQFQEHHAKTLDLPNAEKADETKYIPCVECGNDSAIHIGGNKRRGHQWECTDCGHVFVSNDAP